jgi:hypothetical protein
VEIGQRVDKRLAGSPSCLRPPRKDFRLLVSDNEAVAALHQIESRTDDRGVLAEQNGRRGEGKDGLERGEPAVLARHVVGRGGDRSPRRPAEDKLHLAGAQQIREVRAAAWKRSNLQRDSRVEGREVGREVPAQVRRQPRLVDLIAHSHRPRFLP